MQYLFYLFNQLRSLFVGGKCFFYAGQLLSQFLFIVDMFQKLFALIAIEDIGYFQVLKSKIILFIDYFELFLSIHSQLTILVLHFLITQLQILILSGKLLMLLAHLIQLSFQLLQFSIFLEQKFMQLFIFALSLLLLEKFHFIIDYFLFLLHFYKNLPTVFYQLIFIKYEDFLILQLLGQNTHVFLYLSLFLQQALAKVILHLNHLILYGQQQLLLLPFQLLIFAGNSLLSLVELFLLFDIFLCLFVDYFLLFLDIFSDSGQISIEFKLIFERIAIHNIGKRIQQISLKPDL